MEVPSAYDVSASKKKQETIHPYHFLLFIIITNPFLVEVKMDVEVEGGKKTGRKAKKEKMRKEQQ